MPTWIHIAIAVIMSCWTFIEAISFWHFHKSREKYPYLDLHYTPISRAISWTWLILMVFWITYLIFG